MAVDFYTEWLDVPPGPRPPDYYTLLGVDVFCGDQDAIEQATRRQLTRLDEFSLYPDRDTRDAVQDMMNEVARARVDLVNPKRRLTYDQKLARRLGVAVPAEPAPADEAETQIAPPPQAPAPVEPQPPPKAAPAPAVEVVDVAAQFEKTVWAHLRKWKLNAHEQRLLLAEAAAMGVSGDEARRIIQRTDSKADVLAEKKHKWQIGLVLALAAVAVVAVIVFVVFSQRTRSLKEKSFVVAIEAARKRMDQGDLDAAEKELARAGAIIPDDPRIKEIAIDAALKRKAIEKAFSDMLSGARRLMDRGELDQAASELAKAGAIFPGDPRLRKIAADLAIKREAMVRAFPDVLSAARALMNRGELAQAASKLAKIGRAFHEDPGYVRLLGELTDRSGKREEKFERIVSVMSTSLAVGDLDAAAKGLSEAEATLPGDARLAVLRRKLTEKRKQKFEQVTSAISASLAAGDLAAAAKGLSEAEAALPGDARLAELRRKLTEKRERTFEQVSSAMSVSLKAWNLAAAAKSLSVAEAMLPGDARLALLRQELSDRIWAGANGQEILTLKGHLWRVNCVAFSPDGKRVASGGWAKVVKIWDAASGREVATLKGDTARVNSVAFSPDGKRLASGDGDKTVTIRDAVSGRKIKTLKGHTEGVYSVAFSPDGKRVASASGDKTVNIWNTISGRLLKTLKGHTNLVWSVAFSPDGKRIASGGSDMTVRIWDASSGLEVATLKGHKTLVCSVAFSPDGRRIASGSWDKTVKIWDAASGLEVATIEGHAGWVYSVAFSPDGKRIATGGKDKTLTTWDTTGWRRIMSRPGHTGDVCCVAFSPDGARIISGSDDKTVNIWDTERGLNVTVLKGHRGRVYSVAFSPDGEHIASSGWGAAKIWDASSGRVVKSLKGHTNLVCSVVFSPDGEQVAFGSNDKTVKIWTWNSPRRKVRTLTGHKGQVRSVAFSPDGKRITSGGDDKTVKIWEFASGPEVATLVGHTDAVYSVAFSRDGKRVASGSWDKTVKIWDAASGREVATLKGHTNGIYSVAFSPDGKYVASAGGDKTVKIWNAEKP